MDANKKHITEITRSDLEEVAAAANAYGGDCIEVRRTKQGLKIEIDRSQLARMVRVVMSGGKL